MPKSVPQPGAPDLSLAASAFREYADALHRFLLKRTRHPENADDLAQEVFARLARIENAEFVRQPHSYLFGVAFHVVREFRMRQGRDLVTYDSEMAAEAGELPSNVVQDEFVDRLNLQQQLEVALNDLSPRYRSILLMVKRDGMSLEEAASAAGTSVRMVERILTKARAKMAARLWDR